MRPALLSLLLLLAIPSCSEQGSLDPDDDDAVADDDDVVGDDDDMGPCESGICELTVIAAVAECEMFPDPDPMPPGGVLASSPAPGQLMVMHFNHSEGCCPEISVLGLAYMNGQFIEAEIDLFNDFCECICTLDVQYTLGEVPAGTWTVFGQEVEVE